MDCPAYFESVDERLQAEEERAVSYLDATSSKPRVLDLLVDVFVTKQARPLPLPPLTSLSAACLSLPPSRHTLAPSRRCQL